MRRTIHHPTWKEMLQAVLWVVLAFTFIFIGAVIQECRAQNVVRKGNTFYQQQSTNKIAKDSAVFTGYHYFDAKGIRYPIYMSSKGKCFIWRTSSKTNKPYKQYLPEITKQISICGK
jgi:hypothetical protein